jgi:hypothetical protein
MAGGGEENSPTWKFTQYVIFSYAGEQARQPAKTKLTTT